MNAPTISLAPSHEAIILTLADGREITIGSRDGWPLLIGVLERLASGQPQSERQKEAQAKALEKVFWVPGEKVSFVPPGDSPWRESKIFFGISGESVEVEVVAEVKGGTHVVCKREGMTQQFTLLAKHLRRQGRVKSYTAKGKLTLTLEDLGL